MFVNLHGGTQRRQGFKDQQDDPELAPADPVRLLRSDDRQPADPGLRDDVVMRETPFDPRRLY